MEDFSARLKELREKAGLTQEELGTKAGIHKLTVAKYEQGLREPTWGVIVSLSDALGIPCDSFRGGGEPGQAVKPGPGRPVKKPPADVPDVKKPTKGKKGKG